MINDGINDVPDKTIAVFRKFTKDKSSAVDKDFINEILSKPEKKRTWFTPHFYRCLPLTIGNQYGFIVCTEFDFLFEWNGGEEREDLTITFPNGIDSPYSSVESHFGSGIITVKPPFTLRTPPGVNLMTINPPNYVIPNITVMTGVVEADNLRHNFTFNLRVQIPDIKVFVPAGSPLAGFIPIPRYYADGFELKFEDELFDENVIDEERNSIIDSSKLRDTIQSTIGKNSKNKGVDRNYFKGMDVYGNKFKDHQTP